MKGSLFLNKTYSRDELKGLFEAVLFVNGRAVQIKELMQIFEMSKNEVEKLAEDMNSDYNNKSSGLTMISVAGGYQIVSNPRFKDEMEELFGKRSQNQLSRSALETLAVIAYKQPISKEAIDKIRGVSSTRSINILLGYKMVTISGSTDDVLKSPIYSTTKQFLEMFRIQSVDDLPSVENLNFAEMEFDDEEYEAQEGGSEDLQPTLDMKTDEEKGGNDV